MTPHPSPTGTAPHADSVGGPDNNSLVYIHPESAHFDILLWALFPLN